MGLHWSIFAHILGKMIPPPTLPHDVNVGETHLALLLASIGKLRAWCIHLCNSLQIMKHSHKSLHRMKQSKSIMIRQN
ncbi:hypothetical protein [Klebsiella phage vB_KpnS-MUC-5.2]|nr:hypothetical protein [Klebsiella phage vB_KpnS-MUC-5.2]